VESASRDRDGPRKGDLFFELVREHTGLAVSAVVISIGVLQILALAGFNSISAQAIVQYYGVAQLATLLVVQLAPVLALIAFWVLVVWVADRLANGRGVPLWTVVPILVAMLVVSSAVPMTTFLVSLWLIAMCVAVVLIVGWRGWKRPPAWVVILCAVLVVSGFGALLLRRPVLPAEELSMPKRPVLVGFVLQQTDDSIVVLRERDRQVVRVPSASSRQLCELPLPQYRGSLKRFTPEPLPSPAERDWVHRPLAALFNEFFYGASNPTYPTCKPG
jgi:hypothetical protein